jgi:acyl dehydratase
MNVNPGDELPAQDFPITRADLIRYAGASGDFNVIHWNERVATSVGLPGVIAHGMLTMASAIRVVTDWAGDPGAVVEYGVRFTRPVPVPDPGAATLHVAGVVRTVRDDGLAEVDLTATVDGQSVLAKARAVVRPPAG